MLKTIKGIGVIVLLIVLVASGFYAGKKTAPRVLAIDPNTGQSVSIATDKDVTIYVVGPSGIEPAFEYGHTKDGSKFILVPPEAFQQQTPDEPGPGTPEPQHHTSPLEPQLPPVART